MRRRAASVQGGRKAIGGIVVAPEVRNVQSMRMDLAIRNETPSDVRQIEAVTMAAFRDAAHTSHTEHLIVDALRRCGQLAVSLVAVADEELVGHIAVSPIVITDGTPGWFGLGPLSVLPTHQGRGIGSGLAREALRLLRERGARGCVVLGEPAYYGRFGFVVDPDLVLPGVSAEYFQAIRFGHSQPRGTVTYHAAFQAGG